MVPPRVVIICLARRRADRGAHLQRQDRQRRHFARASRMANDLTDGEEAAELWERANDEVA